MNKLLVVSALLLAACGSKSNASTSPTGGEGEPIVDPTIPSWAPKSCNAYHKAVVQALECEAIDQGKRDEIRTAFDTSSATWKAEKDASAARIEEVRVMCVNSTESVQADTVGKCTAQ